MRPIQPRLYSTTQMQVKLLGSAAATPDTALSPAEWFVMTDETE